MADQQALHSPLSVIDQIEGADEVLLLTYSLNLAFWERFALGRARALGALVTVVADPAVADIDAAAVRHAGVAYLDGRAVCKQGGAFHPKLVVAARESEAHVLVGSGNVTLGGWHGNAELWTVLHARPDEAGAAFHELAAWLSRLREHIIFSPKVVDALERTAALLRSFPQVPAGPRLVHNLDGRLLDALPERSVEELTVYAPFFDRPAEAVRALALRLKPARLRVLVQRRQTVVDGPRLEEVVRASGGEIALLESDRYHHGKVIEWVLDEQRSALVGSPNLSAAALLRSVADGGNCELALITPVGRSLAPKAGKPLTAEEVQGLRWQPREDPRPGLLLLSALIDRDGLHLMVAGPPPAGTTLLVADRDVWLPMVEVPPGEEEPVLDVEIRAGSAVRLETDKGVLSNPVFVLGWRALRRPAQHTGKATVDPDNIFNNVAEAEAFAEDLAALRPWLPTAPAPPAGDRAEREQAETERGEQKSWEDYLESYAASKLGERMLHFALPLPRLAPPDAFVDLGDDDDEGEHGDEISPTAPRPHGELSLTDYQRRRWRRWCVRLSEQSPKLVHLGRLAAVRLLIRRVAAGLWEQPEEWVPMISRGARALAAPPEAQGEERAGAASLAAVCLVMVRRQIQRFGGWDPLRPEFEQTLSTVRDVLSDADQALVAAYAADLEADPALAADAGEILAITTALGREDPIDVAITTLADEYDTQAQRDGRTIVIKDSVEKAAQRHATLRAVGLASKAAPVAALAAGDGQTLLCAWAPPHLVFFIRNRHLVRGMSYELGDGVSPRFYAEHPGSEMPKPEHWQGNAAPQSATRVLEEADVSIDKLASLDAISH